MQSLLSGAVPQQGDDGWPASGDEDSDIQFQLHVKNTFYEVVLTPVRSNRPCSVPAKARLASAAIDCGRRATAPAQEEVAKLVKQVPVESRLPAAGAPARPSLRDIHGSSKATGYTQIKAPGSTTGSLVAWSDQTTDGAVEDNASASSSTPQSPSVFSPSTAGSNGDEQAESPSSTRRRPEQAKYVPPPVRAALAAAAAENVSTIRSNNVPNNVSNNVSNMFSNSVPNKDTNRVSNNLPPQAFVPAPTRAMGAAETRRAANSSQEEPSPSRGNTGARRQRGSKETANRPSAPTAVPYVPPGMPLPLPPSEAKSYTKQCQALVSATRAAVATCGYVVAAEVIESGLGWTVVAHLRSEDFERKDELLSLTRQATLAASKLSDAVHILGRGRQASAFSATPMGFTARLCAMSRTKEGACRGMLEQGVCKYGSRCRWRHPVCQNTLSVVVKVVDSSF